MLIDITTKAFLYRWTQKSTGMWYEGSRSAKGCHPDDGYICSKPEVKKLIKENPNDWSREVLVIGEPSYIRKLETSRLVSLDAKNNPMSFNESNAAWDPGNRLGRKESDLTRQRKSIARQGDKNPMYGLRGELSPHYGKTYTEERKEKQSKGVSAYAKNRPKSHNRNISKALTGNPKVGLKGSKNPSYGRPEVADRINSLPPKLCEHCNKSVSRGNYARWHGNNCKNKL